MPDRESKSDAPSGGDLGDDAKAALPADKDPSWAELLGDSEEITSPLRPSRPGGGSSSPPLFNPPVPGGPKTSPARGVPTAPPVPGIKPGPALFGHASAPSPEGKTGETGDGDAAPTSGPIERAPVRLPTPGVWGKQAPHDAVIDFARNEDAAAFFARATASAAEDRAGGAAPDPVRPQDTQALIAIMAEEIEEVAEAQKAARARQLEEQALLERPTVVYDPAARAERSRSRVGWLAIGGAALAGVFLIGWSMFGPSPVPADEPTAKPAATVAAARTPARVPAPDPEPVPEPAPEPVPEPAGETGEEPVENEPGEGELEIDPDPDPRPEASAKTPTSPTKPHKPSKSSGAAASQTHADKPSSASKPAPTAGKSAAELLGEAKKANASGAAAKAYSLASQSWAKSKSSDAAEEMVLAACKMKSIGKARSALDKVRLVKRRALKQRCKSLGVEL